MVASHGMARDFNPALIPISRLKPTDECDIVGTVFVLSPEGTS
jgi:hypothetical protein